ncbi:MAG: hypothetical protein ACPGRT_02020, partial [Flavobacteriaceae bacterium]
RHEISNTEQRGALFMVVVTWAVISVFVGFMLTVGPSESEYEQKEQRQRLSKFVCYFEGS